MTAEEFGKQLSVAEKYLSESSPMMRHLVRLHGPCLLSPKWRQSPYESLIRAVIYQQLNGQVAGKILERFISVFHPDKGFPSYQRILSTTDDDLRSAGLSRQKVSYIRAIAQQAAEGTVPIKRSTIATTSNDEIIERVTQVRGVGRWTAEMMLIFTLGRLDVLPVDDYGVRKGFSKADGRDTLVTPRELRELGSIWSPYRSVAAWYFWQEASAA